MKSKEVARLHVAVVPEFVASEEFDRMARLFGYEKKRTCKGCEHDDFEPNYCACCNRNPSLDDMFAKVVE